jgi:hypothetical protein
MSDATPESPDVNALLDEARIPFMLKAASIAIAGAGLTMLLNGVQNLTLVHWVGSFSTVPMVLVAIGVVAIGVAAKFVRARAWALPAGIAIAAVLALAGAGFFILSTRSGLFTMFAILGVGTTWTALVLTLLAIGPYRRLMVTRRKLRDAGYDLNL